MYRYIKGEITDITSSDVTLECFDIGYLIRVPNPYLYTIGAKSIIHLVYHVREDSIELFGFTTTDERNMFIRLINVKGLGPKGALAILASANPSEIVKAIEEGNPRFFTSFPGIGNKISQQIILDLKGKLVFDDANIPLTNKTLQDVEAALKALGYRQTEIKTVNKELVKHLDLPTAEMIKLALKLLVKH